MLYVFLVQSGTMMTFDMNLAMANVSVLQSAITQVCSIPTEEQVLLISGGTALKPDCVVSKYSAGTDTNPIFLFTRSAIDNTNMSFAAEYMNSYVNMEERVRASEHMATDHQTLAARSQLARDLADSSNRELVSCNQLVDSQHLQQQGWSALVANLEDHAKNMKKAFENFQTEAKRYFEARPLYESLLNSFPEAVSRLDNMPLLQVFLSEDDDKSAKHTLLTKYASAPPPALLELAGVCKKWIDQLTEDTMTTMTNDMAKLLTSSEDSAMKEVKGIEDRLFRLNEMLQNSEKLAFEQRKYADSLCALHNRMASINDHHILIDLCRTHQIQLKVMLDRHKRLTENRDKCYKAKCELSENLFARIKWVAFIEQQIFNMENKFALYLEYLNRLNFHLNLVEQMHVAPEVYVKTLVEIRRRKIFSTNFLKWASNLSEQCSELHKKEVNMRESFNVHNPSYIFLNDLFPGMADGPPPFATQCPEPFDVLLPNIVQEDLDKLKELLPEFASLFELPQPDVMPQVSNKSMVSDSAFSSEVPSSQGMTNPAYSCTSLQGGHMYRTETLSSLGAGECIGNVPDVFSPTSSPFEDFFQEVAPTKAVKLSGKTKISDDSGLECKKIHLADIAAEKEMFSPIAEEQNNIESDGEEFERVDSVPKIYEMYNHDIASDEQKNCIDAESSIEASGSHQDPAKSQRIELRSTPSEGPQSPQSNLDFHSTEYYFDDSMPSSYTESTGTSAAGKSQHMIKSHHVIVAELQHQLNDKSFSLTEVQSAPQVSRSDDILKMHATMSELQKHVQEFRRRIDSDLTLLKDEVQSQKMSVGQEIATTIEQLVTVMNNFQMETELSLSSAIEEVRTQEQVKREKMLQAKNDQLDQEVSKLFKAKEELLTCKETIKKLKQYFEDSKKDLLQFEENEIKSKSDLEQLRAKLNQCEIERKNKVEEIAAKDDEISLLKKELQENRTYIQMLIIEKENTEIECQERLVKDQDMWINHFESMKKENQAKIERLYKEVGSPKVPDEFPDMWRYLKTVFEPELSTLPAKQLSEIEETMLDYAKSELDLHGHLPEMSTIVTKMLHVCSASVQILIEQKRTSDRKEVTSENLTIEQQKQQQDQESTPADNIAEIEVLLAERKKFPYRKLKTELLLTYKDHPCRQRYYAGIEELFTGTEEEIFKRLKDTTILFLKKTMGCMDELQLVGMAGTSSTSVLNDSSGDIQVIEKSKSVEPAVQESTRSSLTQKVRTLSKELAKERDKLQKIFDKVSQTRDAKLSLVTCDPGDIVLFYYNEKHKNYVAFHFGSTSHFLHSNGLEALKLTIPPNNPNNTWGIGVVTKTDYCIAKKQPNRYNVTHGSVFYRVSVKPWVTDNEVRFTLFEGTGNFPSAETEETDKKDAMSASTI